MKYILLLVVIAIGYYGYSNYYAKPSYGSNLVAKLQAGESLTNEEVKDKAHQIVNFLCNDASFQSSLGSSVEQCLSRYEKFGDMCENRIFMDDNKLISSEEELKLVTSRYRKCVIKNT